MPGGWRIWLDWYNAAIPSGRMVIETLQADQGEYLAYVRMVSRRRGEAKLEEYCWPDSLRSFPIDHLKKPLLRGGAL